MKVIKQYIDPTPTRIIRAFQAAYGEETIAFLWYDMDSLMNSVRECLWKITNDLDPNL
jgi:hypothetical protein